MNRQSVIPMDETELLSLENFVGDENRMLIAELTGLITGIRQSRVIYIWGQPGSGKTHLLRACCFENQRLGQTSIYCSLEGIDTENHIAGISDPNSLVCIDDLDAIELAGQMQKILFHMVQFLQAGGGCLLVSGNCQLTEIGLTLKDLESRLNSGGIFRINPLNDEEKKDALRTRAIQKGFVLDEQVLNYILIHYSRKVRDLFDLLDRLGNESLRSRRKITIPFIRKLFNQ
ncbi:MAG: DnaA regulatory inactivator Hda [Gammaproteobacteria bacterium]|nr:DnaA regulatory inactivator Hda [Gammaproteobacteria bacterium]MCY4218104.1 DnaA regulatory inactivator Hda [Gammaproteobacteria bacterium]MCY4274822.1 DnaA regulatory inactivator Hda [Gammaproteobacteria bacterium]